MTELADWLAERAPLLEEALEAALPASDAPPARLHAAMRHLVFPGGKRLRPALALAGAEAVGAPVACALPAAVGVELIHTYSLVHDDLPCMDDDAERRGRPTVHVAFDEATAVLAGDALLAAAFEAVLTVPTEPAVSAARRLDVAATLAAAAGSHALVGGQVDDLAAAGVDLDAGLVESIHRRKTAALIAAAVVGGGILGGADAVTAGRLRRYGEAMGIVFQIADDLLDAGDDEPCSLVRVLGPEAAHERGQKLLDEALSELAPLGDAAEPLRALAHFALGRDR